MTVLSEDAPDAAQVLALGRKHLEGSEPEQARVVLERGLLLPEIQQHPVALVSALGMLAACYTRLLQFDNARATYEKAVHTASERLEPEHLARVGVICSLASFARSRGALEDEQRAWESVLPVLQGRPDLSDLLAECRLSLEEIATLSPEERQLRASLEAARASYYSTGGADSGRFQASPPTEGPAVSLASLLGRMGRRRESVATLRDGLMMRPAELWQRLTAITAPGRERLLDEQRIRFNQFIGRAMHLGDPESAQAILETLLWRRGIGLEIHRSATRLARRNPEARSMLTTLREHRAAYAAGIFAAPPDSELRREWSTGLVMEAMPQNFEHQALEASLLARLEDEDNRFVSRPAGCAELAARLPEGAVLIEYWRHTSRDDRGPVTTYLAAVLCANRPDSAAVVPLCESGALEDMLLEYLSRLTGRSRTADVRNDDDIAPDPLGARDLGHRIRTLVLDPLHRWTRGARHLLIVTDGLLGRLPFSALPLDFSYAMDRWLISYLHTARDLFIAAEAAVPGPPLVISDPAYDWPEWPVSEGFRFDPLKHAAAEGQAVAGMLGVTPLTHTRATKTALTACHAPEILHVATHGMLLPAQPSMVELGSLASIGWSDPGEAMLQLRGLAVLAHDMGRLSGRQLPDQALRSILVLAGANSWLSGHAPPDAVGNGLMTADDIAAMDLAGNRLAVLSACETGLGVVGIGEGVLGLRSSLLVAGAETVVVSLWSVDDASTSELMRTFYRNLLEKRLGRAEALHDAQRMLRKGGGDDPIFWAPFVSLGSIDPLRTGSRLSAQPS